MPTSKYDKLKKDELVRIIEDLEEYNEKLKDLLDIELTREKKEYIEYILYKLHFDIHVSNLYIEFCEEYNMTPNLDGLNETKRIILGNLTKNIFKNQED